MLIILFVYNLNCHNALNCFFPLNSEQMLLIEIKDLNYLLHLDAIMHPLVACLTV